MAIPVTLTVTPGYTFTEETNVTHAELNQAATPQVSGSFNEALVTTALGEAAASQNYFLNPNFASVNWDRGTTPVDCPAGAYTYRANDWWCKPAGAAITYERLQSGPDRRSLHSALLTGATGVTTVDFGQDLPAHLATVLQAQITVSVYLYNATGASLTPTLVIDSANAVDDFSGITNRYSTASATAGGVAAWTLHTWTVDLTAVPAVAQGARFTLRFPSGALNSGAKSVRIAQAKVEVGAARTAFVVPLEVDSSPEEADATTATALENFLSNGDFRADTWPSTGPIPLTSGSDVYGVEGWWVNAAGGGSNARLQIDPTTPGNLLSQNSAKITGGAGTNEVKIGQNVPSHLAAALRRDVAFAVEFYNGTGGAFAPTLKVDTLSAANDFTSASNQLSETLDSCADGAWTRLTHSFDGATLTNLANGFRIYLEIPNGPMPTTGDVVRVAQVTLTPGLEAPDYAPPGPRPPPPAIIGAASNLVLAYASASTLTLAADEILLKDDAGTGLLVKGLSATVNIGNNNVVNGRDGFTEVDNAWYYVWAISNGTTAGGLLSESATAPTLPPGYRYKALVGLVRNTSSDFVRFKQVGRTYARAAVAAITNIATDPETFTLTDTVPPIAERITGFWATTTAVNLILKMSSDATMGDTTHIMLGASGVTPLDGYRTTAPFDVAIAAPPALVVSTSVSLPVPYSMVLTGYRLK